MKPIEAHRQRQAAAGRKRTEYYLTDAEREAVKKLLREMRS